MVWPTPSCWQMSATISIWVLLRKAVIKNWGPHPSRSQPCKKRSLPEFSLISVKLVRLELFCFLLYFLFLFGFGARCLYGHFSWIKRMLVRLEQGLSFAYVLGTLRRRKRLKRRKTTYPTWPPKSLRVFTYPPLGKGSFAPNHGTNRWLSHLVLCFLWKVWGDAKPKSKAVKYLWEEPENQDMDDMVPSWGSSMHCSPKWCTLAECWTLRFFRVSWSIAWFYDRNSSDQSARTNRTTKSWKLPNLWIDSQK